MKMNNHEHFHVVYDGPGLAEHRMDVRDLAPALIAIADLLTAANQEINGDAAEVRVQVNASFKAGSFGIELMATQKLMAQLRDMLAGDGASAICNAYTILGMLGLAGGGGLIALLRRLGGRQPVRIEQTGAAGTFWISETESIEVDRNVIRLFRSQMVRASLDKTLSPLKRDGIDSFGIVIGDQVALDIDAHEVDVFAGDRDAAPIVSDTIVEEMVQIESLTFKDGNKWRVHNGIAPFYTTIEDAEFLAKIDAGMRFGKGDLLDVDLRRIQRMVDSRLVSDYRVVKVREHRAPSQHLLL
jgi:hypothetical protein